MYDVAVVGLGAMGSATTLALARAGARVVGIDRFAPPHPHGSTHGDTRITRLAIGEGSEYVPLAQRAHALWRQLEAETGEEVLHVVGGIYLSVPGARGAHGPGDFLATTIAAAEEHGLPHARLDAAQLAERTPFAVPPEEIGMYEPTTGYVRPERAVAAQLRRARALGADLRVGETVTSVADGRAVTDGGSYRAGTIVLAAGAWLPELRPELAHRFTVTRQVLHWFALAPGAYEAHRDLPVFIWITGTEPEEFLYGFPALDGPGGGLKIASEQFAQTTDPHRRAVAVDPAESAAMHARYVAGRLPGLLPRTVRAVSCLYTSTADSRFAIGPHPEDERLWIVSACSGHGFKHSAAVGEAVAQRVLTGRSAVDLGPFAL